MRLYVLLRGRLIFLNEIASTMGRSNIRQCPVNGCGYRGPGLKYHLISGKHKNDVSGSDVDPILQIVNRGKQTEVGKGARIRWCPVVRCQYTTGYLRSHLKRRHKIQNREVLSELTKKAEFYEPHKLPFSVVTKCEVCDEDEPVIEKMERHFQDKKEQAPVQAVYQEDELAASCGLNVIEKCTQ